MRGLVWGVGGWEVKGGKAGAEDCRDPTILVNAQLVVLHRCTHCIFSPRRHRRAQVWDGHSYLHRCRSRLVSCLQPSHLKYIVINRRLHSD